VKVDPVILSSTLGIRIEDAGHLIDHAAALYVGPLRPAKIRKAADHNRKTYAEQGLYLQALIHDQIYRYAGGDSK
jgi:hypothetical protein